MSTSSIWRKARNHTTSICLSMCTSTLPKQDWQLQDFKKRGRVFYMHCWVLEAWVSMPSHKLWWPGQKHTDSIACWVLSYVTGLQWCNVIWYIIWLECVLLKLLGTIHIWHWQPANAIHLKQTTNHRQKRISLDDQHVTSASLGFIYMLNDPALLAHFAWLCLTHSMLANVNSTMYKPDHLFSLTLFFTASWTKRIG